MKRKVSLLRRCGRHTILFFPVKPTMLILDIYISIYIYERWREGGRPAKYPRKVIILNFIFAFYFPDLKVQKLESWKY